MEERFTLYWPNGKHGVNTLNCKALYSTKYVKEDGTYYTIEELALLTNSEKEKLKTIKEPIYPDGWMPLSQEQLDGLKNKTLAWEDGKLVEYTKTKDEILAEINEEKKAKARQEIAELEAWFSKIYDAQIKQAQRCQRLGVNYDNKYGTVADLDKLATEKATRIRELRVILNI